MWRLSDGDLSRSEFCVKELRPGATEPLASADGLHINVLEFVAITINVWQVLALINQYPPTAGGDILSVMIDNTSALLGCNAQVILSVRLSGALLVLCLLYFWLCLSKPRSRERIFWGGTMWWPPIGSLGSISIRRGPLLLTACPTCSACQPNGYCSSCSRF